MAGSKREWLAAQVEAARPAVLVLCEVSGDFGAMVAMRKWAARRLQYDMRFLVGEGGHGKNGIVALVDRAQGSFGAFKRLEARVLGFEVMHKADAQTRAYVGLHGLGEGFEAQLRGMREWLQAQGGGLVLGDFNHVPCRRWRASGGALSAQDRLMRRFCGAVCAAECCGGFLRAAGGQEAAGRRGTGVGQSGGAVRREAGMPPVAHAHRAFVAWR